MEYYIIVKITVRKATYVKTYTKTYRKANHQKQLNGKTSQHKLCYNSNKPGRWNWTHTMVLEAQWESLINIVSTFLYFIQHGIRWVWWKKRVEIRNHWSDYISSKNISIRVFTLFFESLILLPPRPSILSKDQQGKDRIENISTILWRMLCKRGENVRTKKDKGIQNIIIKIFSFSL